MDMKPTRRHSITARLAAVIGILTGLFLFAGAGPAAAAYVAPLVFSTGSTPNCITVNWDHNGSGVNHFTVERQSPPESQTPPRLEVTPDAQRDFFDCGLKPETTYSYVVCAHFITEDGDYECSEPASFTTKPASQERLPSYAPPTIADYEVAPDGIKVTWGPTGDYNKIHVHLSDPDGNVDQREVPNRAHGSYIFQGLRSGVRYRVILQGCSANVFSPDGCGPWSPDVFITTPLPYQEPPPPSTPQLKVGAYTETSVSLEFSVRLQAHNAADRFVVYRDGTQIATVAPKGAPTGWTGTYTDTTGSRHQYHVCFEGHSPRARPCSATVARPKLPSELTLSEALNKPQKSFVPPPGGRNGEDGLFEYGILVPRSDAPHPDTCKSGYVWREAFSGDTVCVTTAMREQVRADNAQAAARRVPGSSTCVSGYVWRVARPDDLVCVTTEMRSQVAADNAQADQRRAVPR